MMKECHLTLDSVAKMTTYELRREVEKRGLLGELSIIDHSTLLRKLVQVLVDRQRQQGRQSIQRQTRAELRGLIPVDNPSAIFEQRVRAEKNERKAAAVERSKKRQADPAYFEEKKLSNAQGDTSQEFITSPGKRRALEPGTSCEDEKDGASVVSQINPHGFKVYVR